AAPGGGGGQRGAPGRPLRVGVRRDGRRPAWSGGAGGAGCRLAQRAGEPAERAAPGPGRPSAGSPGRAASAAVAAALDGGGAWAAGRLLPLRQRIGEGQTMTLDRRCFLALVPVVLLAGPLEARAPERPVTTRFRLLVPADAVVLIEGEAMRLSGESRVFE